MLRKLTTVLTAVFLVSPVLLAQSQAPSSLSGKWEGQIWALKDGEVVDEDPIYMVLKQEGTVVSGTAGPRAENQFPVTKVKFAQTNEGTTLGFEVDANGFVIWFDLKLENGVLKGMANGERNGMKQTARVEVKLIK